MIKFVSIVDKGTPTPLFDLRPNAQQRKIMHVENVELSPHDVAQDKVFKA